MIGEGKRRNEERGGGEQRHELRCKRTKPLVLLARTWERGQAKQAYWTPRVSLKNAVKPLNFVFWHLLHVHLHENKATSAPRKGGRKGGREGGRREERKGGWERGREGGREEGRKERNRSD